MSIGELIDLCSDEESDEKGTKLEMQTCLVQENARSEVTSDWSESGDNATNFLPFCRQFWKVGDHEAQQSLRSISQNGQNHLRVHPKFLHSNATSHKWVFGAIAELLDNAFDETQNGATSVKMDKITMPNGNEALLVEDDGRGMDPESLRRCMSFGFSNKLSDSCIGQYGNGFKTSTMRLGADVIVFSRFMNGREITQSVGILSYTFLRLTCSDEIIVPMVDYRFDPSTNTFERLLRYGPNKFESNLSTLLKWSAIATEVDLLRQFVSIGYHGTKILVFNLWLNDAGCMELDFDSDPEDILINGAPSLERMTATESHIAIRFRYSLRVYSSILYLHLPNNFRIILRGKVVEPHHIVNDLKYCECIKYKPQLGDREVEVITTIGFLKGAPDLSLHGFNVYHKNRLILPFWPVCTHANGKGRGIAGVLEANFIKPTHDKQDFEKSNNFHKLETRLKDMTVEYWDYHCHLVGYKLKKARFGPFAGSSYWMDSTGTCNKFQNFTKNQNVPGPFYHLSQAGAQSSKPAELYPNSCTVDIIGAAPAVCGSKLPQHENLPSLPLKNMVTAVTSLVHSSEVQFFTNCNTDPQTGLSAKGRHDSYTIAAEVAKDASGGNALQNHQNIKLAHGKDSKRLEDITMILKENKELHRSCSEYEKSERELLLKAQSLREQLQEVLRMQESLIAQLQQMDGILRHKRG